MCHVVLKKAAVFLYSVYSVFFGIYIFKKKYTYTHTTYDTATWGRVFHMERRSTKVRGVHGVQKMDDAIPEM